MSGAGEEYFIKGGDGKVFGPVAIGTLVEWARDSRVEPTFLVSRDRESWVPAPHVRELEMTWLVEASPGTFYGPFNRAVVDGLLSAGTLPRDVRTYELHTGRADADKARLEAALAAKTKAVEDLEARAAGQAETTRKTLAFLEAKLAEAAGARRDADKAAGAELAAAQDEIYRLRERCERAEAAAAAEGAAREAADGKLAVAESELADLRSQLEAVTRVSAVRTAEAVQPEVLVSDAPPPKSSPRFKGNGGAAGLAALEAAARRELAAAKRQGIGIGGIFGGRK